VRWRSGETSESRRSRAWCGFAGRRSSGASIGEDGAIGALSEITRMGSLRSCGVTSVGVPISTTAVRSRRSCSGS